MMKRVKRIITAGTHTYPPLNFTRVSTELNLSHMVLPFRHLGEGDRALTVVLRTTAPYEEEEDLDQSSDLCIYDM